MSAIEKLRNIVVIGADVVALATAVNIQENTPNVQVQLLVGEVADEQTAQSTSSTRPATSKWTPSREQRSYYTAGCSENRTREPSAFAVTEDRLSAPGIADIFSDIDDVVVIEESSCSSTRGTCLSLWSPQSVPSPKENPEQGGYLRFWSVLTWHHLKELAQREQSRKTGVSLVQDCMVYQLGSGEDNHWWKHLVPNYRRFMTDKKGGASCHHGNGSQHITHAVSFTTASMDIPLYLQYLKEKFLAAGGQIHCRKVSTAESLPGKCDLVVNCCSQHNSGLFLDVSQLPGSQGHGLMVASTLPANVLQCSKLRGHSVEMETIMCEDRLLPIVQSHNCSSATDIATLHWGYALELARLVSDKLAGRLRSLSSKL